MNMMNMMNQMYMMNQINMMDKINILFSAVTGVKYNLICNKGVTISQVFQEYFARIGRQSLFENNDNKIEFIYNSRVINFRNNNTKIEEFFNNRTNVEIQIVTNDLIGA